MQARFAGTCPLCTGRIEPGHSITRDPQMERWVHSPCLEWVTAYTATMNAELAALLGGS